MTRITSIICCVVTLLAACFLCVGYATLTDYLSVSGTANLEPKFDSVVITGVTALDTTDVNSETHYNIIPTNVQSTISGEAGQSIVYRITAHNYSETEVYVHNGIRFSDAFSETMDKLELSVSLDEEGKHLLSTDSQEKCASGIPVEPGEDFVFYATYTLKEDIADGELLINYVFDPVIYTVTYLYDNEIWTIDCILNNDEVYYVRENGPEKEGTVFSEWINANAVAVDSYPAGNTNSYTLSATWDNLYLIMFVDKDGIVLYQEIFSDSSTSLSASGQATVNQILEELNAEAARDEMSVAWSDYNIGTATSDIVVRPLYTYTGTRRFEPVDRDGDGIIDYYQVEAVSKLNDPVKVPGTHQGKPVEVVNKLYKNDDNFDYGAGVKTIEIGEGVLRLERNSLAYTADLEAVYLPNSLEYIGKNAFSRNWSNDKKVITIYYNGTMAEWKQLIENSHEDWANGITTKDGSRVVCSDGYFEYDHGFIGIGAKWEEHPN